MDSNILIWSLPQYIHDLSALFHHVILIQSTLQFCAVRIMTGFRVFWETGAWCNIPSAPRSPVSSRKGSFVYYTWVWYESLILFHNIDFFPQSISLHITKDNLRIYSFLQAKPAWGTFEKLGDNIFIYLTCWSDRLWGPFYFYTICLKIFTNIRK